MRFIGPGKAIDTDRWFVVSSNQPRLVLWLRRARPASTPATGTPLRSRLPGFLLVDVVNVQRTLLEHLGVQHLVAVAGLRTADLPLFNGA